MSLLQFLNSPENSVARERMVHMKAALQMKLAAASGGYQLQMTEPEIDNAGFDFTAAHRYDLLHLQNKSTLDSVGVNSWDFHPLLFQVPFLERDISPKIDGVPIGGLDGAMGGALLHVISSEAAREDRLEVTYFYSDIFFLSAVEQGIYDQKDFSVEEARDLLRKIRYGEWGKRIKLPKRAFLQIKSPAAIVAFRFHIPSPSNWVSLGHSCPEGLATLWSGEVNKWLP
ncbi:MAG: hypothetical protein K2Q29_06595 [Sphingomonadales bacterium]|nr:hypothetical protein [Porphyrobacter sp.]MBY0343506.1 hypothetical protein [Sphingomonadales bacterium]